MSQLWPDIIAPIHSTLLPRDLSDIIHTVAYHILTLIYQLAASSLLEYMRGSCVFGSAISPVAWISSFESCSLLWSKRRYAVDRIPFFVNGGYLSFSLIYGFCTQVIQMIWPCLLAACSGLWDHADEWETNPRNSFLSVSVLGEFFLSCSLLHNSTAHQRLTVHNRWSHSRAHRPELLLWKTAELIISFSWSGIWHSSNPCGRYVGNFGWLENCANDVLGALHGCAFSRARYFW